MKLLTTSASVLALASSASAQSIQSKPFNLILQTADKRYNGYSVNACHEGAAIEGFCLGSKPGNQAVLSQYHLNTTEGSTEQIPGKGVPGILTYTLQGSNFVESEAMQLTFMPSSNVAHPQFSPDYGATWVAFDDQGLMNIQDDINDTVAPPVVDNGTAYYRWYVCETFYDYPYTTIDWTLGCAEPQNPSCVRTEVKRVFV